MDPENGSVSKDGAYPTWKAAYDTLGDGEHIDGFKTKEELVACITNKRPGNERPPLTARKVRPLHGQLPS